jgi:hypothetical protein
MTDGETSVYQSDTTASEENSEFNTESTISESNDAPVNKGLSIITQKNHSNEFIIGNPDRGITTRSKDVISKPCFVSKVVNQGLIATEQQLENIYSKVLNDEQCDKSRSSVGSCLYENL